MERSGKPYIGLIEELGRKILKVNLAELHKFAEFLSSSSI